MTTRLYYKAEFLNDSSHEPSAEEAREVCSKEEANLVSSLCEDGMHRPVIDIDMPCRLVPSTTSGHFHLYIEWPMTWERYEALLEALEKAGVISSNYLKYSKIRGATFCRPEWVKKEKPLEPSPDVLQGLMGA